MFLTKKPMKSLLKRSTVFIPRLIFLYQALVRYTSVCIVNVHPETKILLESGNAFIYAFWHGNSFMLLFHERHKKIQLLISKSQDGEIMKSCAEFLGYEVVRGSSSRGAISALKQLVSIMKTGKIFAISPDGPRGPRFCIQPGVIYLAKKFDLPVIPLAYDARFKKCLNNWDKYMIPFPINLLGIAKGRPVYLKNVPDEEARIMLENALHETCGECAKSIGAQAAIRVI